MTSTLTAPAPVATARRRGPRTAAGRLASSRNSTRHGYSGSGKVLPDDMRLEVLAQRDRFAEKFHPEGPIELDLVYQLALASVRITRLGTADDVEAQHRVRHAVQRFDDARAEEVRRLAELLQTDPAEATRGLRRTADGTDYLGDEWDALRDALNQEGSWDDDQADHALRLLGHQPDRSAAELEEFWIDVDQARDDDEDARTRLDELAEQEYNELVALGERLWEEFDQPDRDSAPERALMDVSPEGQKRARYLADAHRLYFRTLNELERQRQQTDYEKRYARPTPAPAPKPIPAKPATTPQPSPATQAPQTNMPKPAPVSPPQPTQDAPTSEPGRSRNEMLQAMLQRVLSQAKTDRIDLAITPNSPQTPG